MATPATPGIQTNVTCPQCRHSFPLTEALTAQIEERLLDDVRRHHQTEVDAARAEAAEQAAKHIGEKYELEILKMREENADKTEVTKHLREQLLEAERAKRTLHEERANEKIAAERQRQADREAIRKQTEEKVAEEYTLKFREMAEKQRQTEEALAVAQRKAHQGSQQTQGEALELELEEQLQRLFPVDDVTAVKTGARGADVSHTVKTQLGVRAGVILWEAKNAQWQPAWVKKLTADMRDAGADYAVLVSAHMPEQMGPITQLSETVWAASPTHAAALAGLLRGTLLHTHEIIAFNASADERIEALRRYITGPEFRHRMETILDGYSSLLSDLQSERAWFARKWGRQEKTLQCLIDNVSGLDGAFSGLTGLPEPARAEGDDTMGEVAVTVVNA